jgi:hypothetical protein
MQLVVCERRRFEKDGWFSLCGGWLPGKEVGYQTVLPFQRARCCGLQLEAGFLYEMVFSRGQRGAQAVWEAVHFVKVDETRNGFVLLLKSDPSRAEL